jgi:hypothetical protein
MAQQQQQQQPPVENVSNQPNRRRSSSDASSVSAASSYISNNSMVEPVERKPRRKSKTKKGQKPVAYIGLNSDDEGDAESEYSQYSNSVSESVANSGGSFSIVNRENIYRVFPTLCYLSNHYFLFSMINSFPRTLLS